MPYLSLAQQNLVPNPSFEEYDTCPNSVGQLNKALYWTTPNVATSDYFNECVSDASYGCDIPLNFFGKRVANNGRAYVGIITLEYISLNIYTDYSEYIQCELKDSLIKDSIYEVSFFVALAQYYSKVGIYDIGIYFSSNYVMHTNDQILPYTPTILFDTVITDTTHWIKLTTTYKALGNEKYLTIGRFFSNQPTQNLFIDNPNGIGSYIYIDDVVVKKKINTNLLILPNVFTPNNDGVNDIYTLGNQTIELSNVSIYNRWGGLVYYSEDNIAWDGTYNNRPCIDGVYFIVIHYYINNQLKSKQGTIHLIR